MRTHSLFWLYAAVLLVTCTRTAPPRADMPSQRELDLLMQLARSGEIRRVELFAIPRRIMTSSRITPATLESEYWYKVEITDIRTVRDRAAQFRAHVIGSTEASDIRYGVVFYDASQRRRGAVYFDKTGDRGFVNGSPVEISGPLSGWARHLVSSFE